VLAAAGLGGAGTVDASGTGILTSYDKMSDLQNATDLVPGTVVYTKGFYQVGDGGGAFWKVLDAGPADNIIVYQCANNNGSSRFASLIHDGTINIKQAGIRADGKQESNTYSGTGTALDGTTRQYWVSENGREAENHRRLQGIIAARYNVYIPKGDYVFTGIYSIRVRSGLSVIGESMTKSRLIGTGFSNIGVENDSSDLLFENFTVENYASILPPGVLKLNFPGADYGFNPSLHWNINSYKEITYRGGGPRSDLQNMMHFHNSPKSTTNIENRNITVRRLKVKNYHTGLMFGTKTNQETTNRTRNILVEECVFEDILFQPVGANNVLNIRVLNNTFDNVGLQACDFSRGCFGCEFSGNLVTRSSGMAKVEGNINEDATFTRILSDLFTITNNVYNNAPLLSDWHYAGKFVIDNLTGDGIVSGNFLEMGTQQEYAINTTIRRESLDDNVRITGNRILTPATSSLGSVKILNINRAYFNSAIGHEYPSAGKNVTFENNTVVTRMATVGCEMINVTNATNVILRNNHFVSDGNGYVFRFMQGCAANVEITGNSVERVCLFLDTTPRIGLRILDIRTILIADNRIYSDYSSESAYLNEPLIRVVTDPIVKTEHVIVRGNVSNRASLLKVDRTKVNRIEVTGNLLQENSGNTTTQFTCQTIAVDALVEDLIFEGNTVWFPNQNSYSGIFAFHAANARNCMRIVMENNKLTLSGQFATGTPSAGLKPTAFLFRNNQVVKVGGTNLEIALDAAKGTVSCNVFDSQSEVKLITYGVFLTDYNQNIGGGSISIV
jgi:hypothetical protein